MKNKILTTIAVAVCLAAGVAQPLRAQDPSRIERSERRRAAMLGLAPSPAETPVGGQYSPHTLEDLRAELLNIADSVQEFAALDRKSTRLNSSHGYISYAVFCLKKKKDPRVHIRALVCRLS